MRRETERAEGLRGELARLDSAEPVALDARRVLASARKQLRDLAALRHKGGLAARPLLTAVLGGRRFEALPVIVDGRRTWQISVEIGGGYLSNVVSCQGCPWTVAAVQGPHVWSHDGVGARGAPQWGGPPSAQRIEHSASVAQSATSVAGLQFAWHSANQFGMGPWGISMWCMQQRCPPAQSAADAHANVNV
jgi:hypothetical protein